MRRAVRAIVVKDDHLLVMHRNKFGLQYYALIGGAIEIGETQQQALDREMKEETGVVVKNPRFVILEDAGPIYGIQYIYLCDYVGGEPALAPHSPEAKITAGGQNLYTPMWLPLADLPQANLLPAELKEVVVNGLRDGFPDEPLQITIHS